ncbi:MAG: methionyl-tRNA formyltransferase, partial [Planctomycetota bacterium]|nr:methionyl-tRNA formyltransferase [Planctomycetota bacterium]
DGDSIPQGDLAGLPVNGHDMFQRGQAFIEAGGCRGLQEQVILSGSWNLNPWFVKVEQIPMTEIPIGYVGVVVSYGVILKPEMLALPKKGLINAHASLLPLYRGAAPIQRAIRDGRSETGVTIMRIVEQLDAGDMILTKATPIDPKENAGVLRERLAELSGVALLEALALLDKGKETYTPQDHGKATYAPKVEKEHGLINWKLPAREVDLLVRAMTPKPGAQTRLGAKRFIVMEGFVEQDLYGMGIPGGLQSSGEEGIRVCTGKDLYRITRIKPDNGRNMTAGEFVRGHHIAPDARFG